MRSEELPPERMEIMAATLEAMKKASIEVEIANARSIFHGGRVPLSINAGYSVARTVRRFTRAGV